MKETIPGVETIQEWGRWVKEKDGGVEYCKNFVNNTMYPRTIKKKVKKKSMKDRLQWAANP
jgi:hypothetical protein